MKTRFNHLRVYLLLIQPFSVKPQNQYRHSFDGGNQESKGIRYNLPRWMTRGLIISPDADIASRTET